LTTLEDQRRSKLRASVPGSVQHETVLLLRAFAALSLDNPTKAFFSFVGFNLCPERMDN
jgi:hypothetical protein